MVRNISKDGKVIKDMSKITVPINDKTVRAYEIIVRGRNERKSN